MSNGKTFVKITNQQIYDKLEAFESTNTKDHEAIKSMINSEKVKLAKQAGTLTGLKVTIGILSAALLADIGWFIVHVSGS